MLSVSPSPNSRRVSFQVPFIAFYRKEYVEPELNINDLWKVWQWDEKVARLHFFIQDDRNSDGAMFQSGTRSSVRPVELGKNHEKVAHRSEYRIGVGPG